MCAAFKFVGKSIFALLLLEGAVHAAVDLDGAFKSALKKNETVSIQSEKIEQAAERYGRAKSSFFPTIDGVASYTRLPDTGLTNAFNKPDRPEVKFTANVALFRGGREFAGIRQTKASLAVEQHQSRAIRTELYQAVAESFFETLIHEQDAKNLEIQLSLSKKRENELAERKKIGRSRASELLAVQVAVANLEAQSSSLDALIQSAREKLSYLTGLDRTVKLNDDALISDRSSHEVSALSRYLARVENRPEIAALLQQLEAAEEGVAIARGQHLPSADVFGNYYLKRTGVNEGQDWDVTARLTLPIFSGGSVLSQVEEAASSKREADLRLANARRVAEQQIRSLWAAVRASQKQMSTLKKALDLAERNYRLQDKEYSLGLVTNLDVIQALNAFYDTRRSYDRVRFQTKLEFIRLETAAALREY
ncbi:MAG TPA: TolC family protein [Oligoflexia bacterium]|nr:TolC family protein [Oligoflexia bacterium]